MNARAPSIPSAGVHILNRLRFSHPPPFAMTMSESISPGTNRVCTTAGVLSPVFVRRNGCATIEARR